MPSGPSCTRAMALPMAESLHHPHFPIENRGSPVSLIEDGLYDTATPEF